ncbi:hypothetical protein KC363_g1279 [Hortaea werneckii]|nr:hypothetical protein KC361_g2885 [Hortaea werneckii]KAI6885171.1 hypothetical protein KC325_g3736 [Hortaea werneckii]KAI6994759.1 hypothetical protein KC359_g4480 [Hortaea werneckii]KAI7143109.1 hypothetical protein KC344_g6578 [Hortaea werneckii]KAI7175137.1 hypothetical protein KC360_g3830 [Hortaea werneckii]
MAIPLGVLASTAASNTDDHTGSGSVRRKKAPRDTKSGESSRQGLSLDSNSVRSTKSPRKPVWKPAKKHQKSLSAKALASNKRARSGPDEDPTTPPPGCLEGNQQLFFTSEAKAEQEPAVQVFELPETSPRGSSTTRPKHIPIVIPKYDHLARDHTEERSRSTPALQLEAKEKSTAAAKVPQPPRYKLASYGPTPETRTFERATPRHVEIQIPSWAQPVLKQSATPPRLDLSYSTFIDPFLDVPALSPPDMSQPTPDSSWSETVDSNTSAPTSNQLYANRSQSGSQSNLISAASSQTSLVGLQAAYESASASEAESSHEDAGASHSGSHSGPGQAHPPMTPSGTNTANLSGLVCNVHRTTGREPHPLVGATTTVLGDKLYVFGGRRLSRTKQQLTSNLYELDLIRRHWTKLEVKGDIPPPRYFHSVCPLGDTKLVCYGGMSPAQTQPTESDGQPEVIVMSDIHIYDVPSRTWTKINTAESPQGRYAHCAAILPSAAVFASSSAPTSAMHHNPSGNDPNAGQLGVALDGAGGAEMVVVGGQDSSNHYIEQVSVFNLRSLKWTGTNGMGRSCGAYRSVVTPLTTMSASQIGAGPHAPKDLDEDEDDSAPIGSGAPMLVYSNYNFLDVKLELQVRLTDGSLTEKHMHSGVSPPGLRFPNGGVIDNHFVVSGTFLTSSKQEYALWALDLRTLTWSRIDAGGSIFSQGSWNRGVLWNRRNSFVILGNRKRNLVDDYNNRRINFSNMCVVELEAFGLYDNPRRCEPMSSYVSASGNVPQSPYDATAAGRRLAAAAEDLGTLSLTFRELADMDFLAIDGTRIPVNSRLIARRWGRHFIELLKESAAATSDAVTETSTLRPGAGSHPSRNSSITITPSVTSGATTLTNNSHSEMPDARGNPPSARSRLFYLPHTAMTLQALLHFLYTSTLPMPSSPLATPQVYCSLLQLARPYRVDGLLEAVIQRLHESLDGRNAAAIFNAAAMAAGGGDGVQFASAHVARRDGHFPVRSASLAGMEGLMNGVTRGASGLRIDTDMANGRETRNTTRPGQTALTEESTDDESMPGSAATASSAIRRILGTDLTMGDAPQARDEARRQSQMSNPAFVDSPYGEDTLRRMGSPANGTKNRSFHGLPDFLTLRELGTHVTDEDGFSRYMGPSSGVAFTAKVLEEMLGDDQPSDTDFYSLFNLDDLTRGQHLADADAMLWQIQPDPLPERAEADRVIDLFFLFTERVFPVLHQPTFRGVVDLIYEEGGKGSVPAEQFELLAQFYFTMSIGYCFDMQRSREDRNRDQIRALQYACRCHISRLHWRVDGLARLQTLALHSYALIMLRQRSQAMRISAMANMAALEVGLHHDGKQFKGNPLETEMRRRVFWCVFMLHLFNSSLQGLPRALHEADITIAEPSDIDDEHLTPTEVLNHVPARTKIHRFVTMCRLCRILSRVMDVLYTHNKRKQASTRIEQMNRLCCEHLLDQLDFSYTEIPDDLPEADAQNPAEQAILASYANEQLLYQYIRWLIHRPGLAFGRSEPQFAACLQTATDAACKLLNTANTYKEVVAFIKCTPGAHPLTLFVAALTPLFRTYLIRSKGGSINAMPAAGDEDHQACRHAINVLRHAQWDYADQARRAQLEYLVAKVFEGRPAQPSRINSDQSRSTWQTTTSNGNSSGSETQQFNFSGSHPMSYTEQQIEHMTAHDDLRSFVHEAFSPTADPWAGFGTGWGQTPKGI